jgi:hypothetical protein
LHRTYDTVPAGYPVAGKLDIACSAETPPAAPGRLPGGSPIRPDERNGGRALRH